MIPGLNSSQAIGQFLGLPQNIVSRTLEFLVSVGLAKEKSGEFSSGPARIHLPANSPLVAKHHANWRIRAIESLDQARDNDLHYSLVMSISEDAATQMREILLRALQNMEPIMKKALDEVVYTFNVDLFCLKKS
jgi:hypothetical protein